MKEDIHGTLGNIKSALENIKELEKTGGISKANAKLILDHHAEHVASNDISPGRCLKYLSSLKLIAILLKDTSFKTAKKEDYQRVMTERKKAFTSDETYYVEAKLIKKFLKWIYGLEKEDPYPDAIRWLKPKIPAEPMINPNTLITYPELIQINEAAEGVSRDSCIANLFYDLGGRVGECGELRPKDLIRQEDCYEVIFPKSKTFSRNPQTVIATASLDLWLEQHPLRKILSPEKFMEAPLFVSLDKPYNKLTYNGLLLIVKRLARKAGIKKRITPQVFRRTAISEASGYMAPADMATTFGHILGTKVYRKYVAVNQQRANDSRRKHYGIESNETEFKHLPIVKCIACGYENLEGLKLCQRCEKPIDQKESYIRLKFDRYYNDGLEQYWADKPTLKEEVSEYVSDYVVAKIKEDFGKKAGTMLEGLTQTAPPTKVVAV